VILIRSRALGRSPFLSNATAAKSQARSRLD
jgi:hypothetical protein